MWKLHRCEALLCASACWAGLRRTSTILKTHSCPRQQAAGLILGLLTPLLCRASVTGCFGLPRACNAVPGSLVASPGSQTLFAGPDVARCPRVCSGATTNASTTMQFTHAPLALLRPRILLLAAARHPQVPVRPTAIPEVPGPAGPPFSHTKPKFRCLVDDTHYRSMQTNVQQLTEPRNTL